MIITPCNRKTPRGRAATRSGAILGTMVVATMLCSSLVSIPASAASSPSQGVTATTIRIGIPYVDVASLKAVGDDLNYGSAPDAYNAIISNINAHGGINGRKIIPYIVAVNPTSTAAAATACTELTEDDNVFVVLMPLYPVCYRDHNTPVLMGIFTGQPTPGAQPDFTIIPPDSATDPVQLSVYKKLGYFKNKKVGIFAGDAGDVAEMKIDETALAKLHVDVIQSAVDPAAEGDTPAVNQDIAAIIQKFLSAGVNEVVAVGTGANIWPEGSGANQSTYNPPWIGVSVSNPAVSITDYEKPYLEKMTYALSTPPADTVWKDSQGCVSIIRKAYPKDSINAYSASLPTSDLTYLNPEYACTDLALFSAIAKAAGKNLTVSNFDRAGYGLRTL